MILLIDNYDSFTYNVKQEIEILGYECKVVRNDQITIAEIQALAPTKIVISPGPGRPEDAGICIDVLREFAGKIPVLGICLGHQAIGYFHEAKVVRAQQPMHGKISKISHQGQGMFQGLPTELSVARYHSLVIDEKTLKGNLEITAKSDDGEIMGVRNQKLKQEGVQFHPESIATESGRAMMKNFLERSE
jgi:anthranilate synthase/aminodeoxychorismate synthase-like glutamine amidotransferase